MSDPCTAARWLAPLLTATLLAAPAVVRGEEPAPVDFARDVRPVLSNYCFACHGPDRSDRRRGLRLDEREGATAELRSGRTAIVPGEPEASELVRRIFADDPDVRMPPPETNQVLDGEQKRLLRRWIEEGAEYAEHWAYVPPSAQEPPEVEDASWPLNWIDRFLLARLEREGLSPSPGADPITLVRRLHFDLTGLPPTQQEVRAFLADDRPDAYERLVDRLLDSPHYGERMAIYWLDLVRYADTVGYHGDQDHHASPYRDYVIHAFNRNLPFDRFTVEQLAGDLLEEPTTEQKIATAYNRLLQTSHEGGVQAREYRAIYQADRVRNLSAVWMGATMGCAECHDHKYDPYSIDDFYAMAAFFADVDDESHFRTGTDTVPTRRDPVIEVLTPLDRQRIDALDAELEAMREVRAELDDAREAEALEQRIAALEARREAIGPRKVMVTQATEPRTVRVLPRGNWLDESGPVVEPAVPAFLGSLRTDGRRSTRLDLARWLVAPADEGGVGELTARVQANRLWYLFFGEGIATPLDDLGGQGQVPVHPELLDALALELLESGWDWKHMVRLLVTSRAYRQSSLEPPDLRRLDPHNRLVARQSRFRLPAEMIRDTALAVSGLLVDELGGASARPYQPEGYFRHLNFPRRTYEHDTDARQWRRGVYVHWQRSFLHPTLAAFDAPSREECTARRSESNTPQAALALLNDPSFVEAARVLAQRILQAGALEDGRPDRGRDAVRLEWAWQQVVSRPPTERELSLLRDLLASHRAHYGERPDAARALVETGLAPRPEELDVAEHAAWTSVARALLNLNETITRN